MCHDLQNSRMNVSHSGLHIPEFPRYPVVQLLLQLWFSLIFTCTSSKKSHGLASSPLAHSRMFILISPEQTIKYSNHMSKYFGCTRMWDHSETPEDLHTVRRRSSRKRIRMKNKCGKSKYCRWCIIISEPAIQLPTLTFPIR